MTTTLRYLNQILPYQKKAGIKRQAEILGVEAEANKIIAKILDTHLPDVLFCVSGGNEVSLKQGSPDALITAMPLLDPQVWNYNLIFPISGPRHQVLKHLNNLKVTKKT